MKRNILSEKNATKNPPAMDKISNRPPIFPVTSRNEKTERSYDTDEGSFSNLISI